MLPLVNGEIAKLWIPTRVKIIIKKTDNISFWKIDDLGFSVRIKYLKIRVKYNNHQLLHQKGFFFKKKMGQPRPLFHVYFCLFPNDTIQI